MISVGALTPILVCFHKLEITPPSNFNQSCDGTRHGIAGVWLDDLLDSNRSLWLMDERMEATAPTEGAFGMRLFDAG